MEKRAADYVCALNVGQKEFGYVLVMEESEPKVEVVVVDHDKDWVRTLGESDCLEGAGKILSAALVNGFSLNGVVHQAVQ